MAQPKTDGVGARVAQAYQKLRKLDADIPEFVRAARAAMRPWETGEHLLMGAIALALQEMYELGRAGKDVSKVFLQPAATEPEPLDDEEADTETDEPEDTPVESPADALRARIAQTLAARKPAPKKRRARRY